MSYRLVLASGSPRRRELLATMGLEFEVRPADVPEVARPGESPEAMVRRLALEKAAAEARPGELVLGSDTIVVLDGEVLGKPADGAEATSMLSRLRGRSHDVLTAVALVDGESGRAVCDVASTRVVFGPIGDEEIVAYVASGEPLDKAGAYAVQGRAGDWVERLDGSRSNVVGLPVELVRAMLEEAGHRATGPAGDVSPRSRT